MKVLLQLLLCLTLASRLYSTELKIFCYFAEWALHRKSDYANMDIDDIDPDLCTHILWAFAIIDGQMVAANNPPVDLGDGKRYQKFVEVKEKNPKLKLLISIGGANVPSTKFSELNNAAFAQTCVDFMKEHHFDGIDVDWEFPDENTRGKYKELLRELRKVIDADGGGLILTTAVSAGLWTIEKAYDIADMAKTVDYVLAMTYDYHVASVQVLAFNSPLYTTSKFHEALCVSWTVEHYLKEGVPPEKLVVGFTPVGRRVTIADTTKATPGDPALSDIEKKGEWYEIPNGLAYPEICALQEKDGTTEKWDRKHKAPYLVNGDTFVGFENEKSLMEKVDYLKKKNLYGIMIWALDQDDFTGEACKKGRNPYINYIKKAYGGAGGDGGDGDGSDDDGDGDGDGGDGDGSDGGGGSTRYSNLFDAKMHILLSAVILAFFK